MARSRSEVKVAITRRTSDGDNSPVHLSVTCVTKEESQALLDAFRRWRTVTTPTHSSSFFQGENIAVVFDEDILSIERTLSTSDR